MESKHILQSKTFWANVLGLIAMVATSAGLDLGLTAEAQASIVAGILAVVNIVLRLVTREPVRVKAEKGQGQTHFLGVPGPLLGFMLLALAVGGPIACGGVSERVSDLTGMTLDQRCANYRGTLSAWEMYRLSGGEMTPEREAIIRAAEAFLDANCGPPRIEADKGGAW